MNLKIRVIAEIVRHPMSTVDALRVTVQNYNDQKDVCAEAVLNWVMLDEDHMVSHFERAFDFVKRSFLEEVHKVKKERDFEKEFAKDPEKHIERALSKRRGNANS